MQTTHSTRAPKGKDAMNMEPRPYRDEHDLESMRNILIEGRRTNGSVYQERLRLAVDAALV